MKSRFVRIAARTSAALALLLLTVLFVCLDGVDYRPYFKQPYYAETIARLHTSAATNTVVRGELAAGFGWARLTPTLNAATDIPAQGQFRSLPLAGYGERKGRPATGVHDDLYVKAVALRVGDRLGVMLGADALIIPREVTDLASARLEKELGLFSDRMSPIILKSSSGP